LRLLSAFALVFALGRIAEGGFENAVIAAVVGAAALQGFAVAVAGRRERLTFFALDGAVLLAFGLACAPEMKLWAAPQTFVDLFRMTPIGAGLAVSLYIAAALKGLVQTGRRPGFAGTLALLVPPVVFNLLLSLGSPVFDRAAASTALPQPLALAVLRGFALFAVNELVVLGAGLAMGRRPSRDLKLHGLLLVSAFGAAVTPVIAQLGSTASVAHLAPPLDILAASLAAAAAQAGVAALTPAALSAAMRGMPRADRAALAQDLIAALADLSHGEDVAPSGQACWNGSGFLVKAQ